MTKHPEDSAKRIVAPVKNNLGVEMRPKVYRIDEGRIVWLDEDVDWDADSLEQGTESGPTMMDEAKEFLLEALAEGERPTNDLIQEAKEQGIGERTLQRARTAMGVRSVRRPKSWCWTKEVDEEAAVSETEELYEELNSDYGGGYI